MKNHISRCPFRPREIRSITNASSLECTFTGKSIDIRNGRCQEFGCKNNQKRGRDLKKRKKKQRNGSIEATLELIDSL